MDDLKKTNLKKTVETSELPSFKLPSPETFLTPTTEQELLIRVEQLEKRMGDLESTDIKIADISKLSVTKNDIIVIRISGDWDAAGNMHVLQTVKDKTGCKDVFIMSDQDSIEVLKTPLTKKSPRKKKG